MPTTIINSSLLILILSASAFAQRAIIGSVSSVIDGQTIRVATTGGTTLTVRLRSIEVPDEAQPLSETITEHLKLLTLGKLVELRIGAISDDFVVGQVVSNDVDLTQRMLRDGAAWYSEENSTTREFESSDRVNEQLAKTEARGIWAVQGLKRPSEVRQAIEGAKDPLNDLKVSRLAWEQLGYSVESVFPSETFTPATGNCGGTVVGIVDGDTVKIQTSSGQQAVRLAGIDAPEKSQAFGVAAKQHLSGLISGKSVSCTSTKRDRYGRTVGKISLNGIDINLSMVRDGFAWHYKEYEKEQSAEDRTRYAQAGLLARSSRFGLWQDNTPTYPSEYRRRSFLERYYDPYDTHSAGAGNTIYSGGSQYSGGGGGPVHVRAYTRSDGTSVRSYTRSRPH